MAKLNSYTIPVVDDVESLRKHVVVQLNRISTQIGQSDKRTANLSMGFNRLTDVPDPSNPTDAVNLRTLSKQLQGIGQHRQQKATQGYYSIVWSFYGTVSTTTAPGYIILPHRVGSPSLGSIYALSTGTGNTGANILYFPNGTGTGIKLFTADIILPSSSKGPISSTALSTMPTFSVNDVLAAVVTTAGGVSNFTIQLLVNP